jgi:hypothetical protein
MRRFTSILALCIALIVVAPGRGQTASQPKTPKISDQQLLTLIATAKTPAEHQRLADYYKAQANSYLAQSKQHEAQAEAYKKNPMTSSSKFEKGTVDHCDYVAKSFKDDAAKVQELADMHEQMAKDAAQK